MAVSRQERQRPPNPPVAGAIPACHANLPCGVVAHSAERRVCTAEAPGAKPGDSTIFLNRCKTAASALRNGQVFPRKRSSASQSACPPRRRLREQNPPFAPFRSSSSFINGGKVENPGSLISCLIVVQLHVPLLLSELTSSRARGRTRIRQSGRLETPGALPGCPTVVHTISRARGG